MTGYLLRRLLVAAVTLLALTSVAFLMTTAARGDPALLALQQAGVDPTPQLLGQVRQHMGLNSPLPVRYARWLGGAVHGDLGTSYLTNRPVGAMLGERIAPTISLGLLALLTAGVAGITLGCLAAVTPYPAVDFTLRAAAVLLASVPGFWLSLGLILVIGQWWHLLPVAGYGAWSNYPLPVIALAAGPAAALLRLTRGNVLDVLSADYVRTARAKGLPERLVVLRHVVRVAALPVFLLFSVRFGTILGGAVIIESIFAWPGMGTALVQAISGRDVPVIGGFVLITGLVIILTNLLVDLLTPLLDPQVHIGGAGGR
jgi:ABC-type dipeptide/oligopeptide/nickel transport system permease component